MIRFVVQGIPAPQGSKNAWGGESSKNLKPWRSAVQWEATDTKLNQHLETMLGPAHLVVEFRFSRPKAHYRTGKNQHLLRDDAPRDKTTAPDLDKLVRAVCDALTIAGIWRDDSQVSRITASKVYDQQPGCTIAVFPVHTTTDAIYVGGEAA